MTITGDWHQGMIEELGAFFAADADARAVLVSGSVADPAVAQDAWSDVDIKVVLADSAVGRYFPTAEWLQRFGTVIGIERHDGAVTKTLRVCLDDYRRLDVVLVPESSLDDPAFWQHGSLQGACTIVWSRLPDLARRLSEAAVVAETASADAPPVDEPAGDVVAMADAFWFQAAVAIGKVMRDDLLIGAHLALELSRTCLVLQMLRRDRELGTNVHRTGGWGNEAVGMVWPEATASGGDARRILDLVARCCATFDALAVELAPGYMPRASLLAPAIAAAQAEAG